MSFNVEIWSGSLTFNDGKTKLSQRIHEMYSFQTANSSIWNEHSERPRSNDSSVIKTWALISIRGVFLEWTHILLLQHLYRLHLLMRTERKQLCSFSLCMKSDKEHSVASRLCFYLQEMKAPFMFAGTSSLLPDLELEMIGGKVLFCYYKPRLFRRVRLTVGSHKPDANRRFCVRFVPDKRGNLLLSGGYQRQTVLTQGATLYERPWTVHRVIQVIPVVSKYNKW